MGIQNYTTMVKDKKLFTPGPLGCSSTTKEAMLRDLGSRDSEFIKAISDIRTELLNVAGVSEPDWATVLMQGSGTFSVEAVLLTSSPRAGARVLVFANGAVPLDLSNVDFVVSSANKCLQGVPGFSYAICRRSALSKCAGNCRSLSLDLVDQDQNMEKTGQFRFTPPTHTILAFRQAIQEFYAEGGLKGREQRYKDNRAVLKKGMAEFGFKELVPEKHAGHIITCFYYPKHPNFSFETFYKKLSDIDQVIYPGKVTDASCFRIGNIGDVTVGDMKHLLGCIKQVLEEMGVSLPVA